MSSTLFELAKHPEIQSKLRDEINSSFKKYNGKLTYEMVTRFFKTELKYNLLIYYQLLSATEQ